MRADAADFIHALHPKGPTTMSKAPVTKHRDTMVMLAHCHVAPENPRAGREPENVEELAANIAAHGQLTACIAYEEPKGEAQITAGARRFAAVALNAGPGAGAGLQMLHVHYLPKADAIAAGLAEQVGHVDMHPADEALAFAAQIGPGAEGEAGVAIQGSIIRRVAIAFGKSERYVRQRLKLSTLHPPILKAWRDGKLNVEQAAAWANADVDLQADLWKNTKGGGSHLSVWRINELVQKAGLAETDRLVKFVGVKALAEAGAPAQRPLFTFDGDELDDKAKAIGRLDAAAVKTAAKEKLAETVAALREAGWGFVESSLATAHGAPPRLKTAKSAAKSKEAKAKAGCFVGIGPEGKLQVWDNLVKPAAEKAPATAASNKPKVKDDWKAREAARKAEFRPIQVAAQIVGRSLIAHPQVALACVVAGLARDVFKGLGQGGAVEIGAYDLMAKGESLGLATDKANAELGQRWQKRLVAFKDRLEAYIVTLDQSEIWELLAYLVGEAVGIDDYHSGDRLKNSRLHLSAVGRLCNADPAAHATPATAELLASPLVQELTGRTAPPAPKPKPKKPAAKKAKQKEHA